MAKQSNFFQCEVCGNMVGQIHSSGIDLTCCGRQMKELKANTTDASLEKHVPLTEIAGDQVKVKIGAAPHPMTEDHLISWVYLQTVKGGQRKKLSAGEDPEVVFALADDKAVAVYAYCNKHGLWRSAM